MNTNAKQRHGSFRISDSVFTRLDLRSEELSLPRNQLIERYLDEGLRRDRHPLIVFRDGAAGRRPTVLGTRLDVWQVVDTLRAEDGDTARAADYLHCSTASVAAALSYYAEFTDEVDAFAVRARQASETAEEAWQRERRVLFE